MATAEAGSRARAGRPCWPFRRFRPRCRQRPRTAAALQSVGASRQQAVDRFRSREQTVRGIAVERERLVANYRSVYHMGLCSLLGAVRP